MSRSDTVRAILIRHSESTGNDANISKGDSNHPVSEQGARQSEQLATRIARYKPTVVISSPLDRATHPAEAIARRAGVAMVIDHGLKPPNFGKWQDKPMEESEPKIKRAFSDRPDEPMGGSRYEVGTGHTPNEFVAQNSSAMRRVQMLVAQGERPAVVTHSRNLRMEMGGGDPTSGGPEPAGHAIFTGKRLVIKPQVSTKGESR